MYSGTTIRRASGNIVGVHQKIDRAARRMLRAYLPDNYRFPFIKDILRFEGNNGPDGIKRKSPGVDEPWHFIDPSKSDDRQLLTLINDNIYNLAVALKDDNYMRAAFEAAWLSHAVVDGLTPAHHYPLGDKIEELWGKKHQERSSLKEKGLIHGSNHRETISKNWEYWGAGGVFSTHIMFEMGVASAISTEKFMDCGPNLADIKDLKKNDFESIFLKSLQKVDSLKMYDELGKTGWTARLAKKTRNDLVPETIKIVILAWYQAVILSESEEII